VRPEVLLQNKQCGSSVNRLQISHVLYITLTVHSPICRRAVERPSTKPKVFQTFICKLLPITGKLAVTLDLFIRCLVSDRFNYQNAHERHLSSAKFSDRPRARDAIE
jgi:hypothetical protein